MGMFKENDLKWPLVVRDDVGDWHSANSYRWMRSVYEPQDLSDERDYFPSGYELSFTRGELEIHELYEALSALDYLGPGLLKFRQNLLDRMSNQTNVPEGKSPSP